MNNELFGWVNEESQLMLDRGYLQEGQSVYDKVAQIADRVGVKFGPTIRGYVYEALAKGWMSASSPIWANFTEERGLPIACFGSYVNDDLIDIYGTLSEVAVMTKMGGGTSGYFGGLRVKGAPVSKGGASSGIMSFVELFDSTAKVVTQAGVRRGAFAAYLDIESKEVEEFLKIKDQNHHLQSLNFAVNVSNEWMDAMLAGDRPKRELWAKVLRSRREKGMPYVNFIDTINANKPQVYKDLGLRITHSNLCNEIHLPDGLHESFVCCLLSLNLELFDEWKDSTVYEAAVCLLEVVLDEFIEKTKNMPHMEKARNFAIRHRALGVGVLGWHSLLQSKMIPFESFEAQQLNVKIFQTIKKNLYRVSEEIADTFGPAPIFLEQGVTEKPRRHTTLMAVAPTTSSSSILGQASPGIEPYASNYYVAGLAKGSFTRINKHLTALLEEKGRNDDFTWKSIINHKGSVQHLDFLTEEEKNVFKTFEEISPFDIISQAAARQPYIDQGQSLNLKIPNSMPIHIVNQIHIEAYQLGLKGLYYQRGTSLAKEKVLEFQSCSSCEA